MSAGQIHFLHVDLAETEFKNSWLNLRSGVWFIVQCNDVMEGKHLSSPGIQ